MGASRIMCIYPIVLAKRKWTIHSPFWLCHPISQSPLSSVLPSPIACSFALTLALAHPPNQASILIIEAGNVAVVWFGLNMLKATL